MSSLTNESFLRLHIWTEFLTPEVYRKHVWNEWKVKLSSCIKSTHVNRIHTCDLH